MKTFRTLTFTVTLGVLALGTGCATTVLQDVWAAPDRRERDLDKVLVVMATAQPATRRAFESHMVETLKGSGVQAVASYTLDPADTLPSLERLAGLIEKDGFKEVLLVNPLGRERETVVSPGMVTSTPVAYRTWRGHYRTAWHTSVQPPTASNQTVVSLDARLYDTRTDGLLWTAVSRTTNPESTASLARELADRMVTSLQEQGLMGRS